MKRYVPAYAGLRRVNGLALPAEQTHVMNSGGVIGPLREVVFKITGLENVLVKKLRVLRPELLHAHFGADGLRALPLARRLHIPLIVTFHGTDATCTEIGNMKVNYGHRRYLARKSELQTGADRVIAVSEFVRSKLLAQGFPEDKVMLHYIGIDTKFFSPQVESSEPIVLFAGRLTERKGLDYLIRAMAEVQNEFQDLELVILGDGPERAKLEIQAKSSLRKYRFMGAQSPEEVRNWMNRAQIFAAPSIRQKSGEEEGFGMVYIEAQAMKKPVVSFRSGGIVEAVEHGVTGFLAPEREWRKLAEYIALLARDANLRLQMGRAGRERVLRLFDLETQTALLEEIYLDVVSRAHSSDMRASRSPLGTM
jgi:glycosyltransferase involved in cell wall biosynthesis